MRGRAPPSGNLRSTNPVSTEGAITAQIRTVPQSTRELGARSAVAGRLWGYSKCCRGGRHRFSCRGDLQGARGSAWQRDLEKCEPFSPQVGTEDSMWETSLGIQEIRRGWSQDVQAGRDEHSCVPSPPEPRVNGGLEITCRSGCGGAHL